MATAQIGPTGYGTYGIIWKDFPAMERRGGYSGPFDSRDEAVTKAREIMTYYEEITQDIEDIPTVNP